MGFLDKAKTQAQKLQETVVDKTSTLQRDRKVCLLYTSPSPRDS